MSISSDNVALTPEQRQYIVRLAEQTGTLWDEVLNEALVSYRPAIKPASEDSEESFFVAASRLGLIGCVTGGPPDLSTNSKYMEGFGQRAS